VSRRVPSLILLWATLAAAGCASEEEIFTEGRIENRCNESIPICGYQASCVLGEDAFLRAQFPSGHRMIVRSEVDPVRLRVRLLFTEESFPGTELLVRAYSTGCADYDEHSVTGEDVFEQLTGGDAAEYELDVTGRGDHMVEVFSDMAAEFLLVIDQEQ